MWKKRNGRLAFQTILCARDVIFSNHFDHFFFFAFCCGNYTELLLHLIVPPHRPEHWHAGSAVGVVDIHVDTF